MLNSRTVHIFTVKAISCVDEMLLGVGPMVPAALPLPSRAKRIVGVSRDSSGAPLGACVCSLFFVDTSGVTPSYNHVSTTVSDSAGNYEFNAGFSGTYRVTFDKTGVGGLTVNTLYGDDISSLSNGLDGAIYVSPSGNDANGGSVTSPLLTLSAASTKVAAGISNLVVFRGGTYTGLQTFSANGTPDRQIIVRSYPGETPIFTGGTSISMDDALVTLTGDYVTFDGFTLQGYGVVAFTVTIASPGVCSITPGLVPPVNSSIRLATSGALPTGLTKGSVTYFVRNPNQGAGTFELSLTSGGASINTSGTQSGTHNFSSGGVGIYMLDTISSTVRNCDISGFRSAAINCSPTTNVATSSGNSIINNLIYRNSQRNNPSNGGNGWAQGITVIGLNCSVIGNSIYENWGEGLGFISQTAGQVTSGCIARSNIVYDNFSINVYLDNSTDCIVDRNFIYSTGNASFLNGANRAEGIAISSEVFAQTHNNGIISSNILVANRNSIYYFITVAASAPTGCKFVNNTIVNSTVCSFKINADGASGNIVANNLFYQASSIAYTVIDAGDAAAYVFSNNSFFGGTGPLGTSQVSANPGLASPGTLTDVSYKITSSSPCYLTGDPAVSVAFDYFGAGRQTPASIGAHDP